MSERLGWDRPGCGAEEMDLHMHSTWSDGADTAEEMIREGIRRGMKRIGISDHSHADWDVCGMARENIGPYRRELEALREVYRGQIEVWRGLERDYYADDFSEYDYVIGSVHAVRMADGYFFCVDWMPDRMERDCETYFRGDWYSLAEAYFRLEADVVRRTRCDIIGHFDLVSKFCERRDWFDPAHPRYRAAWQRAADALIATGKPFEINTGAISRGYRTDAYPAREIRAYIRERGGRFILSSDAHEKKNIGFAFDRFVQDGRGGAEKP